MRILHQHWEHKRRLAAACQNFGMASGWLVESARSQQPAASRQASAVLLASRRRSCNGWLAFETPPRLASKGRFRVVNDVQALVAAQAGQRRHITGKALEVAASETRQLHLVLLSFVLFRNNNEKRKQQQQPAAYTNCANSVELLLVTCWF